MVKRIYVLVSFMILGVCKGHAQPAIGQWRDYFAFNDARVLSISGSKLYCAVTNGYFTYDTGSGELNKYTTVNGLSEVDITAVSAIPQKQLTFVGYKSGNIDVVFESSKRVVGLPFIKDKPMLGSKCINHFYYFNSLVYVSTDFGLVVIDPDRLEVKDTYFIVENAGTLKVNRLVAWNGKFWAATSQGVYTANTNDPLLISFERWSREQFFTDPTAECRGVTADETYLLALEKVSGSDILWMNSGSDWVEVDRPFDEILGVSIGFQKIIAFSSNAIQVYSLQGEKLELISSYLFGGTPKVADCVPLENNALAVADKFNGLVIISPMNHGVHTPTGPFSNNFFHIDASANMVVAASGAYDAAFGNFWNPFIAHTFSDGRWSYYADWFNHDAVRVKADPRNPNVFFVASWGGGLYKLNSGTLAEHYNPDNSTLQSVFPGQPYCRIAGMDIDAKGNLWVANSEVPNPISVLTAQGVWRSFPYATAIGTSRIISLTVSPTGIIWLALARDNGLFSLNSGNDVESANDDIYLKFRPRDANGNILSNEVTALAFDRDGYLWLGTNQGVLVSYNPQRVLQGEARFQKIKIPDVVEGLAVYLLETEEITCVDVDGGNRKWFGTAKSGVYLFSADGTKQIHHFNTKNSPLPSNTILSVKAHPLTGEVFIATDKGLVAYRSDASEPANTFDKVYAFPNPVRPTFNGLITIAGLMDNSVVKITDIAGNIVYETRSNGGLATWDGKNRNGQRVATGVYLIFCSDSRGEQAAVAKLLFVK